MVFEPFIYGFCFLFFFCLFFNPSLAKFLTMFILAQVNRVQTGAILRYRRRQKNSNDDQNLMFYEITQS